MHRHRPIEFVHRVQCRLPGVDIHLVERKRQKQQEPPNSEEESAGGGCEESDGVVLEPDAEGAREFEDPGPLNVQAGAGVEGGSVGLLKVLEDGEVGMLEEIGVSDLVLSDNLRFLMTRRVW